jgi:hypothetical protein
MHVDCTRCHAHGTVEVCTGCALDADECDCEPEVVNDFDNPYRYPGTVEQECPECSGRGTHDTELD